MGVFGGIFGGKIHVFTDHRNLTFDTLSVQRVLRWRLFMDEFDLKLHYIKGAKNVLADCFSQLPRMDDPTKVRRKKKGTTINFATLQLPKDDTNIPDPEPPQKESKKKKRKNRKRK